MRAFLPELSRHLNWQIAFLRAFHSDFSSQLALDKWWTLHVVQFTGHDLGQTWPNAESWQKLDELIRVSEAHNSFVALEQLGAEEIEKVRQRAHGSLGENAKGGRT